MIQGTFLVKRVAAIALLFLFTASGGARWILAQGVALPSDQVPPRQSSFYFKGTVGQATEVVGKSAGNVDPGQSAGRLHGQTSKPYRSRFRLDYLLTGDFLSSGTLGVN